MSESWAAALAGASAILLVLEPVLVVKERLALRLGFVFAGGGETGEHPNKLKFICTGRPYMTFSLHLARKATKVSQEQGGTARRLR
jgi:hypothetical protein